jgi:putative ATPase
MPLADTLRPKTLNDIVGQKHLIGPNAPLRKIIESKNIPNMIFYGPPGVGKTTIAQMISEYSNKEYYKLNGTSASLADVKKIIEQANGLFGVSGIILYLDEIQYFNKKQQQSILEYIENGKITLIASTTENPYFYIHPALLSRSVVFEFKGVTSNDLIPAIEKGFNYLANKDKKTVIVSDEIKELIANNCGGDVRKSLNIVDMAYVIAENDTNNNIIIDYDLVKQITYNNGMASDRDGDYHFDLASGLMKSIRGSDPDAAIFYLAKLLNQGDLITPIRRILCSISEDIGLAYPQAASIVKPLVDSALQLGLPEARIPLAEAVIFLATSPKSNSAYNAINAAMEDVKSGLGNNLPRCIKNSHFDGDGEEKGQNYLYPHDYENSYCKQQYLPDDLKNKKYYIPSNNKYESQTAAYWNNIKNKL